MKDTRYILLVLLSSLLMLIGCSRREMLDDYPVSGVEIELDWTGVTNHLPEGVRVIFYPKDGEGRKIDTYLSARGGGVKVPPGRYSVVVYNYDTETVQIRGDGAYETIEAFTGHCSGLGIAGTEKLVWGPDPLYVVQIDELKIKKSEEALLLNWKPKLVVKTYSFKAKVEGLEYVSSVIGSVEGMAGCYCLGRCCGMMGDAPLFFEARSSGGEVSGSFTSFGMLDGAMSRMDIPIKMTLAFVKVDHTIQKVEMDITEVIANSESGGTDGPIPGIELPLDEGFEVEKPTNPPDGGDGGIGGDVGDWGDEDEVPLPVP